MAFSVSRRGLAGVAAAAASTGMVTLAQAKTMDEVLQEGVLRVGIHPNSPPFSGRNAAGEWEGFDVAIANLLAAELKIEKVEFVPTETAQRVPYLVADNWATFFLTLVSAALAAAGFANDFTLIVLGVVVLLVEVNIARLIVTLPPLQIAMFLIAQLVGVAIGLVVLGFVFPVPPEVADAAVAATALLPS